MALNVTTGVEDGSGQELLTASRLSLEYQMAAQEIRGGICQTRKSHHLGIAGGQHKSSWRGGASLQFHWHVTGRLGHHATLLEVEH
jgi:hypothetical protein